MKLKYPKDPLIIITVIWGILMVPIVIGIFFIVRHFLHKYW